MNKSDNSYYRKILDAVPLIIFVVDDDLRIQDLNDAAKKMVTLDRENIYNRRGGEVLRCLHSNDVPEGCGRGPLCKTCIIRNSITDSLQGQKVTRRRTKVELITGGTVKELELLITASPMPESGGLLVLLIIEDISEMTTLKNILPICAKCKKIRDDNEYWHNVESYLNDYIGVDFADGICPECMKEIFPFADDPNIP